MTLNLFWYTVMPFLPLSRDMLSTNETQEKEKLDDWYIIKADV